MKDSRQAMREAGFFLDPEQIRELIRKDPEQPQDKNRYSSVFWRDPGRIQAESGSDPDRSQGRSGSPIKSDLFLYSRRDPERSRRDPERIQKAQRNRESIKIFSKIIPKHEKPHK